MPPCPSSARSLYLPASFGAEREGDGSACGDVSDVPSRRGAWLPSSSGISGFLSVGGICPSYAPRRLLCLQKTSRNCRRLMWRGCHGQQIPGERGGGVPPPRHGTIHLYRDR